MKSISFFLLFALPFLSTAQHRSKTDKQLIADIDKLLSVSFTEQSSGAAVLVGRKGQVIYEKGFGLADMELGVKMRPDMVFRIASMSKQFTAVAILQLMEQGKLSLQDEITQYLPDYNTEGKKITIEHLLTHTSGIGRDVAEPEFKPEMERQDFAIDSLIAMFKHKPLDFAPGEKWAYSNLAYMVLGYIIEKASGMPYDAYLQEHIFEPLKMEHTFYDKAEAIIPNRAKGYAHDGKQFLNAPYFSMTIPFSAGALMSTVGDLYKWNEGLKNGLILKKETVAKAHSAYILNSGKKTSYGYGWSIVDLQGSPSIEHSGGIPGFLSNALYLPKEDIYVVVLSNCTCARPNDLSYKIGAMAMGKPFDFKKIDIEEKTLNDYVGVYENEDGEWRVISKENNMLFSQRKGGVKNPIAPYDTDKFFFVQTSGSLTFSRDATGKVSELLVLSPGALPGVWKRSDKPDPTERQAITLEKSVLEQYVGTYQADPTFGIEVRLKGEQLQAQATQQPAFSLFAEKSDFFFIKEVDAQIEFKRDAQGKILALVLHQGDQEIEMKKED